MRRTELTGNRYGRLLVGECVGRRNGHKTYQCYCDCGNEKILKSPDLKSGRVNSCGCLKREMVIAFNQTHNLRNHRLYSIWAGMKTRCNNPNVDNYCFYGGRGIQICDEWQNNFKSFYDWAIANGYKDDLTIDRINVNENYEPRNCRWATNKIQGNNRRACVYITLNSKTKTLAEWCTLIGINYKTVQDRRRRGWPKQEALLKPVGG